MAEVLLTSKKCIKEKDRNINSEGAETNSVTGGEEQGNKEDDTQLQRLEKIRSTNITTSILYMYSTAEFIKKKNQGWM